MNKKICILILLLYFSNYENISAQNPVLNFKLKQKSSLFKSSALYSSLQSNSNIVTIDELEYAGNFLNSSIGQVMCQDSSSLQEVMNILENNPDIEWVEENKRLRVFQTGLPNDTLLNRQWHWFTVGADYLYANDYFENNNVKIPIAIIDTGVDYQHSDLAGQFWINSSEDINSNNRLDEDDINGIDDDRNGIIDDVIGYDFTDAPDFPAAGDYLTEDPFPMDDYGSSGHGTPVAGLIAAKTDNITGIAGISPNAEIMVLRAGSASGYLEVDDVVKAIFYAVDNGAKIINMSFGDSYPSQFLHQAVRYAFDNGVVQVAAAGNSGNNLPNYPAAWPEVLGIASINSNNHRSGFSNYGSWISFSLPGESVLSTATNDNYTLVNGTSFACPVAVAVISLPLSQVMANGDININSFYSQLETKSVQLGGEAFNNDFGYGLLKFPGVLQSETLEISIQSPNSFQTIVGNSLPLIATVWGANIKNYSFKIKLNNEELWQSTTYTRFVFNDTLEIIDISSFPEDTLLTLTVVIRTYDNELLYKISPFKISNTIPGLEELKHIEWWNRAIQGDFIKITSNVKCNASITAFDEENELRFTQPSEGSGTEHYFTVNETNNYSIKFELQNSAGSSGFVPDTIVLLKAENNILPGMPYKNSIQFPYAGFTIDTLTDFNNNGLPEIIFSKSGADTVYGILTAAEIYETNDSLQYQIMASTKKPFIPRSIGDVNGDGKAEIFAGYGAKIYLLSDIDGDNFPFETAWKDTIDNWAVYLKDFEQDGIYEGIVRKNNEYQIWKWDNSFQPSVLYNFELPEEETPLYSVPNVLFADLEGDGAKEVIIGDFNGNLFIFKQDDLYSYRFIQKIATGYQAVTDHIITDDINSDGADELYFIHSVIPDAQSDQLMNYSYWQLNKLELVENELKLSTLFNFKGVQLSSHFFNGLQKIDGYLVITMSPHQYWVKFEDGAQPIFFEDFININKIYTGNLAGDSILIGSIDEKLAVKKIFSHNQNNFLSHTDFFQKSDTIIHAEWKWQLPEIDTIHLKIKKD
ncbi:MAG: S8 family serine peptidase, partial [Calditrichia bacterium]|nr:S8 family serine peptidase [Calditrichia bacterium]